MPTGDERLARSIAGILVLPLMVVASAGPLAAQVVINEVLASNAFDLADEDGDASDWLELRNSGTEAVSLTGYALTDDDRDLRKWVFPETSIAPGAYLLVWCSGKDRTVLAEGRITEPNSPLFLDASLISTDSTWRYLTGAPDGGGPPSDWASRSFDDSSWAEGKPAFGFGADASIRTLLPKGGTAAFFRRRFDAEPGLKNLVLQARYDDGFVAYLNGVRVAASRFPEDEEPTFASAASGSHSGSVVERFDLSQWLHLLEPSDNVLAVALLNVSASSNDLFLLAELGTVPPVFHTNFRIDGDGEALFLVDDLARPRDLVVLPQQATDQSYGRAPDGTGTFRYYLYPTPLARNGGPTAEEPLLVADTKFSHDRGFYDAPVAVEITTETEGAEIRYTFDGREPTQSIGAVYDGPITIATTAVLRARAFKEGLRPTNVDTHTYIFLDDVIRQDFQRTLDMGFPRLWGSTTPDYGMDPDIVGPNDIFGGVFAATIRDDLKSLPTISIVMDIDDMFGARGIYTNSTSRGEAWERPASAELIDPAGEEELQVDCGIRVQGGWFRQHSGTLKHSLRLLFKREYGPTKLRFPFFGEDAADRFDTITLRAGANDGYSWSAARLTEQYTRDEFGRSLQLATGNAGSHGRFVHLYINGVYWGLYNPVERPDHSFSASYLGGEKEDWDAIHDLAATNGDTRAWSLMVQAASRARGSLADYQALQGRNVDGTPSPDLPHFLDVPNYVDYLIVNLWGGNWDWPRKNWWATRHRGPFSTGFKFYCWDYENTMGNNRSRSPLGKNALQNDFSSAGQPHVYLRSSPEYRQLFADRIHRLLFNGGVLVPDSLVPRYEAIADRVERAIVCESARWGDQHHHPPLTLREWETERNWIVGEYLPRRSDIVLGQFRAAGLYPTVEAPVFSRHGGISSDPFHVLMRAAEGVVYYTVGEGDPRLAGGSVSPSAAVASTGTTVTLAGADAPVRLLVPRDDSLGLDWTRNDFVDSEWLEGRFAVGYETETGYEDLITTDVGTMLHGTNASIYLRVPFEIADPSQLAFVRLRVRYDDGFVAYINGERVADRNALSVVRWNSRASRGHADRYALLFEDVELPGATELLVPGWNVLAVHGLNWSSVDADFLFQAELVVQDGANDSLVIDQSARVASRAWVNGSWSALNEATFIVDRDLPLRVTEILYHPGPPPAGSPYGADEFEFLELQNVGSEPLDLSEIRLRGGVEFDFAASDVEELGPGEYVLLVENLKAFQSLHDFPDLKIAGEYDGRLSNEGERLVLEAYLGEMVLDFEFDDDWYSETDGEGRSLVFVDPRLPRESWNDPAHWRPSGNPGGSPGRDDSGALPGGWQRQGDANQDGSLDITDAVLLARGLYTEEVIPLPCEGVRGPGSANGALYDIDGDDDVSVTDVIAILDYFYRAGPAPALGTDCVWIDGCPNACSR